MKILMGILLCLGVSVASAFAIVYAGFFNVAADAPHSDLTYALMETVRSRSISARSKDIRAPQLDDEKLIAAGAEHYAAMCSGCHLSPGNNDTEIRAGLYPKPPDLTKRIKASPEEAFWVIKHGIKMSGMPAWGKTHNDSSIWGLVAFLQKLPELTSAQYQALAKTESEVHHQHTQGEHDHTGYVRKSQDTDEAPKGGHHDHEQ
jgi:mono/diheme cytochrome c family protein